MILKRGKKTIKRLTIPGNKLGEKTAKGGFWVFSLRIVNRLFRLTRTIVLARLLSPNDFGLFGIALLTLSALETFSQTGFRQALIQKKEDIKPYLDTAWTIGIMRGVLIAAILFFLSPFMAGFFNAPTAESILKVVALAAILQSLTNIKVLYFEKELEFHKYFIYQFAGTFFDIIVAIGAVILLHSVWALVLGFLAGNLARCVVSYFIEPYFPFFRLDLFKANELFGFGKWILGSSILVFLLTQGDDIFVGKLLGASVLGLYQIAYRISNLPATEFSHLIAKVTYPAYSKLQDNPPKLKEAYLKVLQLTAFLSIPIAGLIFILAPEFTKIFLGEKWMLMVPAMQVLALYGMLRAIGATTGSIFLGMGKPQIRTKIQFAQLVLLAVLIYPLTIRWGIFGTSMAVTAYALIFNIFAVYKVYYITKSDYKKIINIIVFPVVGTLIMVFGIIFIKTHILNNVNFLYFFLLSAFGIFSYLLTSYFSDLFFNYGIKKLIRQQFKNIFSE